MKMNLQRELDLAKRAAVAAAAAILKYYHVTDLAVTMKSQDQPLTEADLASNRIIKETLRMAFPADGWLSEEDPDNAERFDRARVWIVDPLDGTTDFVRRNPEFAVSIGLIEKGEPVLGVICNPVTKELFWAVRGEGAFCDGKPLKVTDNRDLDRISLIVSASEYRRGEWKAFTDKFIITPTGGTAYKMALVAAGRADGCFTLQGKSEWDICAGHVIVSEAGGVLTTVDGSSARYNNRTPRFANLVYSNPHVHAEILKQIHAAS